MTIHVVTMFVRWKKRIDGRVVTKNVAYLGTRPKDKLAKLVNQDIITEDDYDTLIITLADDEKTAATKRRDRIDELKNALGTLTEKSSMSEFHDMSSHMAHVDGVRHVLKKIEEIKQQFPDVWSSDKL